jgi:hypothetical protein
LHSGGGVLLAGVGTPGQAFTQTKGNQMASLLDFPPYMFFAIFLTLLVLVEVGFRRALRKAVYLDQQRHDQVVETRNEIAVLLSLLLGFTLAMVLPRFDQRKLLVIEEANAIGTTSLRAQMLPESARANTQELLRGYVNSRLDFFSAGLSNEKMQAALAHSKQVQNTLWQQAVVIAQQTPTPITALYIQSLNEMIDLDAKRVAALENRIPPTIWIMMMFIAALTCLTVGYSQRRRFLLSALVPPLMIAIVMTLIADLDTPRSGLITIGQQSMESCSRIWARFPHRDRFRPYHPRSVLFRRYA